MHRSGRSAKTESEELGTFNDVASVSSLLSPRSPSSSSSHKNKFVSCLFYLLISDALLFL